MIADLLKDIIGQDSQALIVQSLTLAGAALVAILHKKVKCWLEDLVAFLKRSPMRQPGEHSPEPTYTRKHFGLFASFRDLRIKLDSIRVSVYQFQNGQCFSVGDPVWKVTCTNEQVATGYTFDSSKIRDIIASNLIDFINPILEDQVKLSSGISYIDFCSSYKDEKQCSKIPRPLRFTRFDIERMPYSLYKVIMEDQGTGITYATTLISAQGNRPIGIFCIQYVEDTTLEDADASIKEHMCDICECIMETQFLLDSRIV